MVVEYRIFEYCGGNPHLNLNCVAYFFPGEIYIDPGPGKQVIRVPHFWTLHTEWKRKIKQFLRGENQYFKEMPWGAQHLTHRCPKIRRIAKWRLKQYTK